MEKSMKMKMIVGMLMMWMVVGEAAIACGSVASAVAPCMGYLTGQVSVVPSACCVGVKRLNDQATTTVDRRAVCGCLKSAAGSIKDIKTALAAGLPSECGVSIPYKISPSTDCNTVN